MWRARCSTKLWRDENKSRAPRTGGQTRSHAVFLPLLIAALNLLRPFNGHAAEFPAERWATATPVEAGLDEALRTLSISEETLAEVLAVPSLVRDAGAEGVLVRPAEGMKCPRCWQVRTDVEAGADGICARCRRVVGE